MSTDTRPAPGHSSHREPAEVLQVIVYGHSALFYWWPLWVAGYVMALLTWLHHDEVIIGGKPEWFHPSQNLGVIYTLLFLLLIVITSAQVRGMKAALIIAGLAFLTLLFVHMDWWERILGWLGHQSIYLSLGFYLFSSSLLFIAWVITVFVIDHLSFWRFRPGQVTHEYLGVSWIRVMTPTTWSSETARRPLPPLGHRSWIGRSAHANDGWPGRGIERGECSVCDRQDFQDPAVNRHQTRCA